MSKQISEVILERTSIRECYWEPFLGGGAMASKLGNHFDTVNYSDVQEDLILMWDAVLNQGWVPPVDVSLDEYKALKVADPSPTRGFVGFGGSFGGKWFEGYARGGFNADGTPRNHQAESSRAVVKDAKTMYGRVETNVFMSSYVDINPQQGGTVYCDPPYANTTNYSTSKGFDHSQFWDTMTEWSDNGVNVYVSEYTAPDDWRVIWEKPLRSTLRVGSENRHMTIEKLFTRVN